MVRRVIAAVVGVLVLFTFVRLRTDLLRETNQAEAGIWNSLLSPEQKYFWFDRLRTNKAVAGFIAFLLGLISASYAWRAFQKPD